MHHTPEAGAGRPPVAATAPVEIPRTVREAAAALRAGELTSVALTRACLARADELDPKLGTYLARFDDSALAAAARADAELAGGVDRGLLHGIPVGIKDFLATVEGPTTANSLVLDPAWGAGREGPVMRRLKDSGAVVMGKTTTMEFAAGLPDFDGPFPIPRNPWDLDVWSGGSSSGAANGVAAGLFLAAVGTDTGGSIRAPAAYCNVSGLVPTFGRVPKSGCVPSGLTLDRVGPLARTAWDCAALLEVVAGHDPSDHHSVARPVPDHLAGIDGGIAGVRVGVPPAGELFQHADPAAQDLFEDALGVLRGLGATTVETPLPYYGELAAATMVTVLAELLAYHAPDLKARFADYSASTRSALLWGVAVTGGDYVQAQRVRRVGQRALAELFTTVDVVVMPTATLPAPTWDLLLEGGMAGHLGSLHTPYWNSVGNPAMSVPMGFTAGGLPLGLQLAGMPFDEPGLLRIAHAYQSATDWHLRLPTAVAGGASGSPS